MKILHLDDENYPKEIINNLISNFDFTSHNQLKLRDSYDLKNHFNFNSYDIIFVKLGFYFDEEMLQNQSNLKFIITPTTGLNHLDLDYLDRKKVQILSLKGEYSFLNNIQSTSEHVWSLILALSKKLLKENNKTRDFIWKRDEKSIELNQKTIGIIGYGRLGKIIHHYAKAFNMKVLINDIDDIEQTNTPLNELLPKSDIVVLLIDYRKENDNFINKDKFKLMKNEVIFVNCSRGEHVNEDDLLSALERSEIGSCGLDVMRNDSTWNSIPRDNKLIQYSRIHDNLLITPHIGGYSDFSILETRRFVTNKLYNKLKQ
jgi:D-3-phosphoglycerate dehydrogenase